ncbi:MAG: flagellar biosynthetic protein FliR [Bacteriovoracaceae bacterium]
MNITITDMNMLTAFWLMFLRWGASLVQLPHFDEAAIPGRVKVLLSFVFTFGFAKYLMPIVLEDLAFIGAENYWILAIYYVLMGLVVGYFVKSIMFVFQIAGSLITQQIGFSMLNYFDPNAGQQVGPFEKLIKWTILIMIITTPALTPMIKGLIQSFYFLSIKNFFSGQIHFDMFFTFFKGILLSAIVLASPLIFTNVLISCLLGVIARTVPQMNVIMVSFVINIGLGLLVFIAISNEFFEVAFNMYVNKLGVWFRMLRI